MWYLVIVSLKSVKYASWVCCYNRGLVCTRSLPFPPTTTPAKGHHPGLNLGPQHVTTLLPPMNLWPHYALPLLQYACPLTPAVDLPRWLTFTLTLHNLSWLVTTPHDSSPCLLIWTCPGYIKTGLLSGVPQSSVFLFSLDNDFPVSSLISVHPLTSYFEFH